MGFECDECGKTFKTSTGMEKYFMATHYIAITFDDLDEGNPVNDILLSQGNL